MTRLLGEGQMSSVVQASPPALSCPRRLTTSPVLPLALAAGARPTRKRCSYSVWGVLLSRLPAFLCGHTECDNGTCPAPAQCVDTRSGLPAAVKMYHKDRMNHLNVKQASLTKRLLTLN